MGGFGKKNTAHNVAQESNAMGYAPANMSSLAGFYKGYLEQGGFKSSFIVYAASTQHAIRKALDDVEFTLPGARVHEIEGPYQNMPV